MLAQIVPQNKNVAPDQIQIPKSQRSSLENQTKAWTTRI